jgi:uncharacterized protein (DUF2147 family)
VKLRLIIAFIAVSVSVSSFAGHGKESSYFPELIGVWMSANKKQKVRVYYNVKTKMYTGRIEWMYEDDQANGRKLLDVNNPNPKLKSRRVTGVNLLYDFKYEHDNRFRGYIYDPISGNDYRCLLTIRPDKKTAEIRGYILFPWIGRTEIATKISE